MEVEMSLIEPNHRMLSVVYQDVGALKPRATNPRTHSKKQITQLANAIRRFGFTNPVLGSVGIQDSHPGLVVIQAADGPIRFD